MTAVLRDVFADTSFWIALVVRQDQDHRRAQEWSLRITGRIVTTVPVLFETAKNALARPAWRAHAAALVERVMSRSDIDLIALSDDLLRRGWKLYHDRPDKGWSLTDCVSFEVMRDRCLIEALTADDHFRQAGFRAVLLDEP